MKKDFKIKESTKRMTGYFQEKITPREYARLRANRTRQAVIKLMANIDCGCVYKDNNVYAN